ncbi:MAG: L-threonylcarbamoyladenylate synthase [Methanobacteriaceae archaeon]|nr:L-threonylcarbamoyladenylate synthase [Methanobacteriaceae archaeon]MDP2835886.1 L-threonylcarbamoyladenylate synthase [Methanobacteriaceae archaeon]MDP3034131.1 L-threonylcarbamoyladenylate synthase [Methanobacteriaceae archaeon]MDP3485920.1 L-threonylcarbamoyladenylate synthase [Methanobacteriaceae archaeon]
MKIVKINPQKIEDDLIEESIRLMKSGKIILYPTDTLYGLGANIFDENALKELYSVKKRSTTKPISVCVSNIDWIPKVAKISSKKLVIISKILPGPFTIILKKKDCISELLTGGSETIGIRIPDSEICQKISQKFPITTTSANISGQETKKSVDEILEQLDTELGLVIDAGPSQVDKASTVIDFTLNPPIILRKGSGKFSSDLFD